MSSAEPLVISLGERTLDLEAGWILDQGHRHPLSLQEQALLRSLLAARGAVCSGEVLMEAVWGRTDLSAAALQNLITRLRRRLEAEPRRPLFLQTVRGEGYRLVVPEAHRLPPRGNLSAAAPLVGRAAERALLRERLAPGCLLSLIGPGGVGKTTLAIAAAVEACRRGACAEAWFLDLTAARSLGDVVRLAHRALQAPAEGDSPEAICASLGAWLGSRPSPLVVLDNCEQIVADTAALLAVWCAAAPGTAFVVTSRSPIGLPEEQILRLGGLTPEEADHLFVQRARDRTGQAPQGSPETIRGLTTLLDRLPLAIEMAAARLVRFSPEALAAHLAEDLSGLHSDLRDMPDRHRTLWAVLSWSWRLLTAEEQDVLAQCAAFRGGWLLDSQRWALWFPSTSAATPSSPACLCWTAPLRRERT